MTWPACLGFTLGLLVVAAVGLRAHGERRWAGAMRTMLGRLEAGRRDGQQDGQLNGYQGGDPRGHQRATLPPTRFDTRELEGLPPPVQRYFRAVLQDGQPIITAVTIDIAGRFNMSPTGEQWKPFTSRQRVVTRRPGFVWDARIAMLPGVKALVVDGYLVGKGLLHATVQGLFTVAEVHGEGEIARGEFMLWCAETAWYPTALLPSQGVRWAAVDEHSANATMVDGPISLTLLFRFNAAGLIGSFRAEARGAMVGDQMVMAPSQGIWSDYRPHQGVQLPFTGEVAWMRPEGRKPYFVGMVRLLRLETMP